MKKRIVQIMRTVLFAPYFINPMFLLLLAGWGLNLRLTLTGTFQYSSSPSQSWFSGSLCSAQKVPPQYLHLKGIVTSSPQTSHLATLSIKEREVKKASAWVELGSLGNSAKFSTAVENSGRCFIA
ncbi:MAG: hypothetical protein XD48_2384 [Archaeoglobus fulgidus]|uniref:Uncharacterized protein n=1 Tax=Archaeoglobus fulgidus TaxID=2234 RepID=A0A117KTQ0_ARCFL|nr:MAG: hypothetical protein XD48_2384 [Archaeoglobus fulgidus]